nr:putative nuclease HARBI1 [Tanacetum cinerariifolium]
MLHDLSTSGKCHDLIRMSENAFRILCQKLESVGGLRPTQRMTIEEQVARGYPAISVLAACTFDLKFTYILSRWEGMTSDSRIIKNALTREDKLLIPNEYRITVRAVIIQMSFSKRLRSYGTLNRKPNNSVKTLQALTNLHDLFSGFMNYFWSRDLNISNFAPTNRKILSMDDMLYSCLIEYPKHFTMTAESGCEMTVTIRDDGDWHDISRDYFFDV